MVCNLGDGGLESQMNCHIPYTEHQSTLCNLPQKKQSCSTEARRCSRPQSTSPLARFSSSSTVSTFLRSTRIFFSL
ncbi:hypothetical protein EYF80_031751 [Liparis tanakae]|uniref:Uncharacterized protein n=1 Tax=Liparis tanakae TaxID=230148 RepID=A0A4Z2GYZ8_9TELE|nr:hypothetical protein EYF80_031751 [Liparis tanakae]